MQSKFPFYARTFVVVFCFFVPNLFAQINHSGALRLTDNWDFHKGDLGSVWEAVRSFYEEDSQKSSVYWENVTLPHCFNAEDAVDPYVKYYQGAGWYRTFLDVENPYVDGRILLHFEGAGQKTKVFVHLTEAASHVGGYDEWTADITEAVDLFRQSKDKNRFGGKVPLLIRCDNSRDTEMIPSDLSDFNLYGGLYRYLNLVYTPSLSISSLQTETSLDLKKRIGKLDIKAAFTNHNNIGEAEVRIEVFAPDGKMVADEQKALTSFAEQNLLSMEIKKPHYWSTDNPHLYSCKVTLSSQAGIVTYTENFGFRHIEFSEKGPFYLNGERLLLRGTHRHEDHAGVSAAMTEEMIVREMEMIKAMGANFIRLGHYQQSRIVLELCDRLGLMVWEEIPWCRGGLGGDGYQSQAKRMLTNMIVQHRNHPSVILWGLGNENDWPGDFPEFERDAIRAFMVELNDLSHRLDPSRMTCIRRCEFCKDIVDVYSPSIWMGWYRGKYTEYKAESEMQAQTVNRFLHVEWGGDSHAGRHAEHPNENSTRPSVDGDWSETYICDLIDWHLKEQETMPWLTGTAYWPFKDFSTPLRPENPVSYVNQKGVVERDLTPKESYYVFQSYWSKAPMVHIYGHSWAVRWGDIGETKQLKVYSNCDRVELFLNGVSLGIKKRNSQNFPAAGFHWDAVFKTGENTLKAVGYSGKTTITDELSFVYQIEKWNKPARMTLSIIDDTAETTTFEVKMLDENNVLCLDAANVIEFDAIGSGKLIVNQGIARASKMVQAANGRAYITLKKNNGKTIVMSKSEGLTPVFIEVE